MGTLRELAIAAVIGSVLLSCAFVPRLSGGLSEQSDSQLMPRSLFAQAAVQALDREFASKNTSFFLLDARSGVVLSARWDNPNKPIPLGSLVKPFTALAYAETHGFRYPTHECRGQASGCWQIRPHGNLDMSSAIAVSCNSYFQFLSERVSPEELLPVAEAFNLEPPAANLTSASLIGLGDQWPIPPLRMATAYLELSRRRDQPGVREIIDGMLGSAQRGTGAAVGHSLKHSRALVKTGTAPCTHLPHSPADGFVIALVPADRPEMLLMIRVHGVAGANAAQTAGRMLRWMEE